MDAKTPGNAIEGPKAEADGVRLSGENGFTFPGVGHYFHGRLNDLRTAIHDALAPTLTNSN